MKISCICGNFVPRMKKYSIEVLEVLSRIVEVEASHEEDTQGTGTCHVQMYDNDLIFIPTAAMWLGFCFTKCFTISINMSQKLL